MIPCFTQGLADLGGFLGLTFLFKLFTSNPHLFQYIPNSSRMPHIYLKRVLLQCKIKKINSIEIIYEANRDLYNSFKDKVEKIKKDAQIIMKRKDYLITEHNLDFKKYRNGK